MNVSAVIVVNATTKSLGFGINMLMDLQQMPSPVPKKPTFEEQVLLNSK